VPFFVYQSSTFSPFLKESRTRDPQLLLKYVYIHVIRYSFIMLYNKILFKFSVNVCVAFFLFLAFPNHKFSFKQKIIYNMFVLQINRSNCSNV